MDIRKILTFVDESRAEAGRKAEVPLRKVAAVAVVRNPFVGVYQDDLSSLIEASVPLGREISQVALSLMQPYEVESYGKGAVVGVGGEQEHGVALLTTVFGNVVRETVGGGKAWISSFTKVASAGMTIDIPLAFKDEVYVRAYYDGITLHIDEGPKADELLICVGVSSGTRPFARVGGMTKAEALARLAE